MDVHKKVIWNAVSAYFMVFVSIFFLISKSPYINHPFVKNHVKVAFSLHILLFSMLFIMSFNFLENIDVFGYSLNTLISSFLSLLIFWMLLYGAFKAYNGKTITLKEIFHASWIKKDIIEYTETKNFSEEDNLSIILAHVPFLWYISYGNHKKLPHIKDISLLNMLITIISIALFALWYTSLASIVVLSYIIWSVFQSLRLIFEGKLITLNMSIVPTPEEKYILQKSLFSYVWNSFKKNTFVKLSDIIKEKTRERYKKELADLEVLKAKKISPLPTWVFYIPIVNIIALFFLNSRDIFHIRNGIIISIFFTWIALFIAWDSPLLLFTLLPICYGIWYRDRKAYRMPYIYDFYAFFANIVHFITNIFHKTRKLQKTDTSSTLTINETKKES